MPKQIQGIGHCIFLHMWFSSSFFSFSLLPHSFCDLWFTLIRWMWDSACIKRSDVKKRIHEEGTSGY